MSTKICFDKIRTYKGNQHHAFEELICQLARLSRPESADYFVRKEGSGGDAGVECFWKLKDGSEHAWQAKYFFKLEASQWKQISNSVETALEKNPKLSKYYICLPLDRTDQRKENQESQLDKWYEKVKGWKKTANSKNMSVEFVFWGASEILDMLSTDNSHFSGRALYWFNYPVLQIQHLKSIAEKSKTSLGDRFSPKLNIDLPIAKSFDGIGLTPNWHKRFLSIANKWFETLQNLKLKSEEVNQNNISSAEKSSKNYIEEIDDILKTIITKVDTLSVLLRKIIKENTLFAKHDELKKIVADIPIKRKYGSDRSNSAQEIRYYLNKFMDAHSELFYFLSSKDMEAFSKKSMLLSGDAGAGKSHLLCDITLNRLADNLPTLFLLGQHYAGGDPLKFISNALDLNNHSHKKVLGALDALGETHSTRTLIIIDAINEGLHNEEWQNYIIILITELQQYPHIAFVFSCRSTYLNYLLPDQTKEMTTEIEHRGFPEPTDIYKYLEKQNIFVPNVPLMSPEFFNPLFMKIVCKILTTKGTNKFPTGLTGIKKLFDSYIDAVSIIINKKKKYIEREKIVLKALYLFALKLFPNNLYGLPIDEARQIIQSVDQNSNQGEPLLNELLKEGILSEDIISLKKEENLENGYEYRPIVRFTYQRFSDYFISESLVKKEIYKKPKKLQKIIIRLRYFIHTILFRKNFLLETEELKLYFKNNTPLGNLFFDNKIYFFKGIIESLFVYIADKFKVELYDLVERDNKMPFFEEALKSSFLWRSSNAWTQRTFDLLLQMPFVHFHSPTLEVVLKLSTEPNHPCNADFLHEVLLIKRTLVDRDRLWSTHIFFSYHYGEDFTIKNLINWPHSANLQNIESESVRLYAITLIWFTTSSHRELRDKATKSAIVILSKYPTHLLKLMDQFSDVDDLYVRERLYAVAYGVAVNIEDTDLIKKIAEKTYEQLFKAGKPVPHILLRDYARSILEFAYNKKLLSDEIDPESFRPPYKSNWPIENPMDSEIDTLVNNNKLHRSIYHSLMGPIGDFGIYTMNCVHKFSPTSLTEKCPETGIELQRKFINTLSDKQKVLYRGDLKNNRFMKKQQEKQIKDFKEEFKNKFGKEFDEEYINMTRVDRTDNRYDKYLAQYNFLTDKHEEQLSKEKNKFIKTLTEEQREEKRWLFDHKGLFDDSFMDNSPAAFSRKWAKRWICKQVYEMGWSKDLFETFDTDHVFSLRYRGKKDIERIGKKYQWIALHKLLAHLADNVHYIGGYDDKKQYEGPWQLFQRDIDPTCYLRKTKSDTPIENTPKCWWQPYLTQFPEKTIEKQQKWFESKNNIPDFKNLLQVRNPDDDNLWTVLFNFVIQQKDVSPITIEETDFHKLELWFRINTIVILEKDRKVFLKKFKSKDLRGLDLISSQTGFLKEHCINNNNIKDEWCKELRTNNSVCEIKHFIPVRHYTWEGEDHSMDNSISVYLPSPILIDKLNLSYPPKQFEYWKNKNNAHVFTDPSVCSTGPSSALIKTDIFNSWLAQEKLCLIWLIGGEKRIYGTKYRTYQIHEFSGVYFIDNNQITGNIWFLNMFPTSTQCKALSE